jgi:broad specificity phosphatase PhoE
LKDGLLVEDPSMTKRLVLARHGEIDPQYAGRFLGRTDVPLSDRGLRQAAVLAPALRARHFDTLCVSPLRRAVQTADPLGGNHHVDPDLREVDFGRWEGRSFAEIADTGGGEDGLIDRWRKSASDFSFPDGESLRGFVARVARVADRLAASPADTVLAITHGGVIRAAICHLLGLDPRNYLLFDVRHASITTIDLFDGRGVLVGLNDTHHLEACDLS